MSEARDTPGRLTPRPGGVAAIDHERVLASLGEALLVVDPEWRIVYWNDAAERITGLSRSAVLGTSIWERFRGLQGTALEQGLRDTMALREPREYRGWSYASARLERGGTYDARSYPVADGAIVVVLSEVGDRMRIERELAERVAESESLRELARTLLAESDTARFLSALCGAAMTQCAAEGAAVSQLFETEGEIVAHAGRIVGGTGRRFPLAGSLTERAVLTRRMQSETAYAEHFPHVARYTGSTDAGPVLLMPLVAHDQVLGILTVSRRKGAQPFSAREMERLRTIGDYAAFVLWKSRLVEAAQEANEAKSTFLATMSHELRTPLTALTGYGELLSDEIVGPLTEQQADVVERMRTVTHHLGTMIEEVLTFSSLEAGREVARLVDTTAAELLRAAAAVIEPLARQKGLELAYAVPGSARPVQTDPDKVRQILVNLAGNAVKFTERGSVRLELEVGDREVRFRVADTGIGIAPEDRARLFVPFSQLDVGLTRRHGGTGLGLYISNRLAQLVGGRIEVESVVGRGSTFVLVLPMESGEASSG